jgi:hypothetical protein
MFVAGRGELQSRWKQYDWAGTHIGLEAKAFLVLVVQPVLAATHTGLQPGHWLAVVVEPGSNGVNVADGLRAVTRPARENNDWQH